MEIVFQKNWNKTTIQLVLFLESNLQLLGKCSDIPNFWGRDRKYSRTVGDQGQRAGLRVAKTESGIPNVRKFINEVFRGSTYTVETAIADLVDNSIEAKATRVDIVLDSAGRHVAIMDNGIGMADSTHRESMKIAAETREYEEGSLGKFGTGMKAASLSQARRLTVATRATNSSKITVRALDIDHVAKVNDWDQVTLVLDPTDLPPFAKKHLTETSGTVVIWENLDRIFSDSDLSAADIREEMLDKTQKTTQHLGMVFHKFISGEVTPRSKLVLTVNKSKVEAWDPYCRDEKTFEVCKHTLTFAGSEIKVTGFVLPSEKEFSSKSAFEAASGIKKWNQSQGFYVYRNNRLIRWGGWLSVKSVDEHTKLARIALEIPSELDAQFQLNVAKSSLTLPLELKRLLHPIAADVSGKANKRYRAKMAPLDLGSLPGKGSVVIAATRRKLTAVALASTLETLANAHGKESQLDELKALVKSATPDIADEIGW